MVQLGHWHAGSAAPGLATPAAPRELGRVGRYSHPRFTTSSCLVAYVVPRGSSDCCKSLGFRVARYVDRIHALAQVLSVLENHRPPEGTRHNMCQSRSCAKTGSCQRRLPGGEMAACMVVHTAVGWLSLRHSLSHKPPPSSQLSEP